MRAGAYAEIEWTWEPPTESPFTGAVGLDGVGTVIRARGIESYWPSMLSVPNRDADARLVDSTNVRWRMRVAPRIHNPSLYRAGFFYCFFPARFGASEDERIAPRIEDLITEARESDDADE